MLIIDSVLVNASKLIEKEKIILCCNYKFRLELVEHNSFEKFQIIRVQEIRSIVKSHR